MLLLLLFCPLLSLLSVLAGALEDGVSVGGRSISLGSYESNVLYALRFMVDTDMGGGQWLEVPAGGCGWGSGGRQGDVSGTCTKSKAGA